MLLDKLFQGKFIWFLDQNQYIAMSKYLIQFRHINLNFMRLYFPIDGKLLVDFVDMVDRKLLDVDKQFSYVFYCQKHTVFRSIDLSVFEWDELVVNLVLNYDRLVYYLSEMRVLLRSGGE